MLFDFGFSLIDIDKAREAEVKAEINTLRSIVEKWVDTKKK